VQNEEIIKAGKCNVDMSYDTSCIKRISNALKDFGVSNFVDGAAWRINSVWHDNNVTPGYNCKVLMEDIYGHIYSDVYDADYNEYDSGIEKRQIKRWAYIEDLIPK
jgi:hypothetical protein